MTCHRRTPQWAAGGPQAPRRRQGCARHDMRPYPGRLSHGRERMRLELRGRARVGAARAAARQQLALRVVLRRPHTRHSDRRRLRFVNIRSTTHFWCMSSTVVA